MCRALSLLDPRSHSSYSPRLRFRYEKYRKEFQPEGEIGIGLSSEERIPWAPRKSESTGCGGAHPAVLDRVVKWDNGPSLWHAVNRGFEFPGEPRGQ